MLSSGDEIFIENPWKCKRFSARILIQNNFPSRIGKKTHWTTFCKSSEQLTASIEYTQGIGMNSPRSS